MDKQSIGCRKCYNSTHNDLSKDYNICDSCYTLIFFDWADKECEHCEDAICKNPVNKNIYGGEQVACTDDICPEDVLSSYNEYLINANQS